ncbi:MAG: PQQ-binding-like beta-propeller repeat protein, partial [Verrucomicrobiota bacterium]
MEGYVERSAVLLNQLIADQPGEVELAADALHRLCAQRIVERLSKRYRDPRRHNLDLWKHVTHRYRGRGRDAWEPVLDDLLDAMFNFMLGEEGESLPDLQPRPYGVVSRPDRMVTESVQRAMQQFKSRYSIPRVDATDPVFDAAARRLLALRDAHYFTDKHPVIRDLTIMQLFAHLYQGRLFAASKSFDRIVATFDNDPGWLFARARFHAWTGSDRAGALFDELFSRLGRNPNDPRLRALLKLAGAYAHLKKGPAPRQPVAAWLADLMPEDDGEIWDRVRARQLDGLSRDIDALIGRSLADRTLLKQRSGDGRADAWTVLDGELKKTPPERLGQLRAYQERKCAGDERAKDPDQNSDMELRDLFRRFPWSETALKGLLQLGQRDLEAGREAIALRSFRDVIEHTADPETRRIARVGYWVALAQGNHQTRLKHDLSKVEENETFPWMGRPIPASSIRAKLLPSPETEGKTSFVPLSKRQPRLVKLPAARYWPVSNSRPDAGIGMMSMQCRNGRLLISSENAVVYYDLDNLEQPAGRFPCGGMGQRNSRKPVACRPVIHGDLIFRRWGYGERPNQLAAYDMNRGHVLWGSRLALQSAHPHREIPLGDPTRAGSLLFHANWHHVPGRHGERDWHGLNLICIDAATGMAIWRKNLDHAPTRLHGKPVANEAQVSAFVAPLLVEHGAIYLASGMGYIARYDSRDGRLAWSYEYESIRHPGRELVFSSSPPVLHEDRLICHPRDSRSVVCLDTRTGKSLWRNVLLNPTRLIGVTHETVVLEGEYHVAGLDPRTGAVKWLTPLDEPTVGHPHLIDSNIVVGVRSGLLHLDLNKGYVLDRIAWPVEETAVRNFTLDQSSLYLLTDEPADSKPSLLNRPFNSEATAATEPPTLPLNRIWHLERPGAQLFVPPPNPPIEDKALVYSGEILECIETTEQGGILWRKMIGPAPSRVYFEDGKVILIKNARPNTPEGAPVVIYDVDTGHHVRSFNLPDETHGNQVRRDGPYMLLHRS